MSTDQGQPVKEGALVRARRDLEAGRPDLARERLHGYLYTLARRGDYEEEPYLLLGEACYAMKDFARAGAAWLLTTRSGAEFDAARAAFHARFGGDGRQVLNQVKPRAPSELYPPAVQERLREWGYRYRPYRPRSNPQVETELAERGRRVRGVEIGCIVLALLFLFSLLSFAIRRFL